MALRTMKRPHRRASRVTFARVLALCLAAAAPAAGAQDAPSGGGAGSTPSWMLPDLAAAARSEGSLTVYSSMNEQEGLPLWKMFEDAAGVKVNYVRSSDSIILSRIAIENRAHQRSWDLAVTTTVNRLPNDALLQFDPPQAQGLMPQARGPNRRWYGVYANYNMRNQIVKPSAASGEVGGIPLRPRTTGIRPASAPVAASNCSAMHSFSIFAPPLPMPAHASRAILSTVPSSRS